MRNFIRISVFVVGFFVADGIKAQTNAVPAQWDKDGKPISKKEEGPFLPKLCPSLFKDDNPFEQSAKEFAGLCNLKLEAETKYMVSYRSYNPKIDIFGLKPNMLAVYGDPANVSEINLLFANIGDDIESGQTSKQNSSTLNKEMVDFKKEFKEQETVLKAELDKLLGKSVSQQIGSGNNRESAQRWNVGENTAVMLSIKPQKFIAVHIWKKDIADRKGLLKPVSDNELRALCAANVKERGNKDVVIGEIPMINQGSKGYCAPATYERVLRYLGMEADMYTLAMNGQTQAGGGTTLRDLNAAVGITLAQNGRRFQNISQLNISSVKKYVNLGVPILWSVHVVGSFESMADEVTQQRSGVGVEEWKKRVKQLHNPPSAGTNSSDNYHLRLIVGYNDATDEICFSDSWGKNYTERWLPVKVAKEISAGLDVIIW